MTMPQNPPDEYTVERWHPDIGKIVFTVRSTDTQADVRRKVAVGLTLAGFVYHASPGLLAQPRKEKDKAKESRLDVDIVLQRLWFTCAYIPHPTQEKKPDLEAVRRVVGIIFAGCAATPQYERETYRNFIPLTTEDVTQVLANLAHAPADIPATDIEQLVKWYFGGVPDAPVVKPGKTPPAPEASAAPTPPPSVPPQASPTPPAAAPALDMKAVYKAAWDKYRLLDAQVDLVFGKLNEADRDKKTIWDALTYYANAKPIDLEETQEWAGIAFKFTDMFDVSARTVALGVAEKDEHRDLPRHMVYRRIEEAIDILCRR